MTSRLHFTWLAAAIVVLAACASFGSSTGDTPAPDITAAAEDDAERDGDDEGEDGEDGEEDSEDEQDAPARGAAGDDLRPYERVITEEAERQEGLFTVHRIGDDLYFEIPDSVLDREMLLVGRTIENSAQQGFASGGARSIVAWERSGRRVVLREKRYDAVADSASAIWHQVEGMRRGPVVGAFEVETFGPDSAAVVEVSALYTRSNEQMGGVDDVDRSRSWLGEVLAFPRNVEVEATQTGRMRSGNGGGSGRPSTVTVRMRWSMTLLPDEPMRPRLHDRRVGFIRSSLVDYGRPEHRAEERRYIHRFRLAPSDTAAFRAGELVEPEEPIVFWVDPATPDWLKPWVLQGIDAWNGPFREAGFRDAIRGELIPDDDPDRRLYDSRYSAVIWRPSTVQNATGGQIVDPRSGEILRGEVNMYHNVQNLLRNWYFTQVGPLDERAWSFPLPDSLMGRLVEYVVAHEVGHAIGFPHNMKASAMYPPDSLRSETFLRDMNGHVATLMDYSRFNYVAQPEDSIPPELLVPHLGPYDEFAVRWGYRPILDADSPDAERRTLDRWAKAQDSVPWFRFTTADAPNDPTALTEAVGDADAVRSNELGLRNLRRVMDLLVPVAERRGEDYSLLEELYGQAVAQWGRYMGHVAAAVGGARSRERYGGGERFFPLDREEQRAAVGFLVDRALETPEMLIRPDVLRRIEAEGVVGRIRGAQAGVLETLFAPARLHRLIEYEALASQDYAPYTVAELAEDVRDGVWSELDDDVVGVDVYRRNLQRAYLEVVERRLDEEEQRGSGGTGANGSLDPRQTDVQPVLRGELRALEERVGQAIERSRDRMTRLHLEDVSYEIRRILDDD